MAIIEEGHGFSVGQDFARAVANEVIELTDEYAGGPRYVIGYIKARPDSSLSFMRRGRNGKIRVQVERRAIKEA